MALARFTLCARASAALLSLCCVASFTFAAAAAQAHDTPQAAEKAPAAHAEAAPEKKGGGTALPPDSTTEGSVSLANGKTVAYTAVAGLLAVGATDTQDAMLAMDGHYLPDAAIDVPAKPEDQPATARMFYTAYFAKTNTGKRPLVFFYNGGPGSATMYLRMTSMGPVRVAIPDLEHPVGGPYKVENNPN